MFEERKRILYVDDDPEGSELVKSAFRSEDVSGNLTAATSVEDALVVIARTNFDLFVFDHCLLSLTGAQLCRVVRGLHPQTPILVYSALARPIDREMAKKAGANEYLVKPDDFEMLVPTMRRMLANKQNHIPRPGIFRALAVRASL